MTTLVFDALVQPQREVGEHLLTHLARYGGNSASIAFFNWGISRGLSTYTFPLRYPHKKKSQGDRSGERAGHGTSPLWEMSFPGNNLRIRPSLPWKCGQLPRLAGTKFGTYSIDVCVMRVQGNLGSWQHNGRNSLSLNGHSLQKNTALSLRTSCSCRGFIGDQ